MQHINRDQLGKDNYYLYVHTPFCGTCHLARSILNQIETVLQKEFFFELNASLHPEFMKDKQIESVPCLLIKVNGEVKEKIYTFHSTSNIIYHMMKYNPKLTPFDMK